MASTSLIFILWNASGTQAMTIIAMVTMPVTVVTSLGFRRRAVRDGREASRWALSRAGGGQVVTVERRHASQQVPVGPRITGIASEQASRGSDI